jgi:hypothetical protein
MWRDKQLQRVLKEKRRYSKLKEKALDRTLLRTRLGKGYGLVLRLREDGDVILYPFYMDWENLEGRWSKFFPVLLVKKEKDVF